MKDAYKRPLAALPGLLLALAGGKLDKHEQGKRRRKHVTDSH